MFPRNGHHIVRYFGRVQYECSLIQSQSESLFPLETSRTQVLLAIFLGAYILDSIKLCIDYSRVFLVYSPKVFHSFHTVISKVCHMMRQSQQKSNYLSTNVYVSHFFSSLREHRAERAWEGMTVFSPWSVGYYHSWGRYECWNDEVHMVGAC